MVTVTRLPEDGEVVTVTRSSEDADMGAGARPRPVGGDG